MLTLEVKMDDAKVRAALEAAAAAVTPEAAAEVAAEAGAGVVRDWLAARSRLKHRPGQRLNFYLQASDSVTREASAGTALIRIPHAGVAQRFYGGVIKPSGRPSKVTGKPVRRLAVGIPGTPGEGHTPADFGELFVAVRKGSKKDGDKGGAYLARMAGDAVQYLFSLLASVKQEPDATVLPPDDRLLDAAAESILDLYDAAMEGRP